MKSLILSAAVFASITVHAQQPKNPAPSQPDAVITETQRLKLENASLKLSIIQQRAQQAATPVVTEQQETVKAILAANPGFRYDANTDRFVKVQAPTPAPPPAPPASK